MLKRKNKELELKIIELKETNKILTDRLKLYENERKQFKDHKINNLINLLCKKLEASINSFVDISYKEDIESLEILFKILEV